jgi:hypothetical protein
MFKISKFVPNLLRVNRLLPQSMRNLNAQALDIKQIELVNNTYEDLMRANEASYDDELLESLQAGEPSSMK